MAIPLPENVRQLVDRANFAHLATLMEDGSPHSTPVWVGREGDRIVIGTSGKSLKARNTRRDPRVAISMVDFQDPYMKSKRSSETALTTHLGSEVSTRIRKWTFIFWGSIAG